MKDKHSPIFRFDKDSILRHVKYDLKLFKGFKTVFNFIADTLEKQGHAITLDCLKNVNLNEVKQSEGKNYDWCVVNYKNVKLLIRRYGDHFTIMTKIQTEGKYPEKVYGAFTFYSNFDLINLSDNKHDQLMDEYHENPFIPLNKIAKNLFEVLIDRGTYWVQNSACLPVDKEIEIKMSFDSSSDHVYLYDDFFFCLEELSSKYCELFAETTMFKTLPELKKRIGETFDYKSKIHKVTTKLENDYYHGVGITLIEENGETKWCDVYSLTRWYYDNVFIPEPIEVTNFTLEFVNDHRFIHTIVDEKIEVKNIIPKIKELGIDKLGELANDYNFISIPTDETKTKQMFFEVCKIDKAERIVKIIFHSIDYSK